MQVYMGVDVRMLARDLISSWSNDADIAENKSLMC